MSAELKAARHDDTLILTLSNPGTDNALDAAICAAAVEVLSTAERDDSVRAVVLTGADRTFSVGTSLQRLLEFRARGESAYLSHIDALQSLIAAIADCPKPVIAVVEGTAAGAGFALALACDLIVAGASAKFQLPGTALGLTPEGASSWFLARALPRQFAAEIVLGAKALDATRLANAGLINRVVPDGTALDAALNWADELAALAPGAIERGKTLLAQAAGNTLTGQLDAEKTAFLESVYHDDATEGIQASLARRAPRFR